MKKIAALLIFLPIIATAQHTFSIVAVDSITGEIGSAGATCGDSIIWPGTPGAKLISDVIPGVGAIHTQSYWDATNQNNSHDRMVLGDSPQEIIDWLVANDVSSNPVIRQYGVVDYNGGSPRSAAYTGASCFSYKNHILGNGYAIQGNILLGQQILDSMESRFNATDGCLSDKLMAAMQGANVVGADTRCNPEGTSSLSAFLRVAKPTDNPDNIFIDLNIAGTPDGVEPIDELQTKYNNWKLNNTHDCEDVSAIKPVFNSGENAIEIFPNPTPDGIAKVYFKKDAEIDQIRIFDIIGDKVLQQKISGQKYFLLDLSHFESGFYLATFLYQNKVIQTQKIMVE